MKATQVKKIQSVNFIVTFAIVLVFGALFLTLSLVFNKPVPENYVETKAEITKIEEELLPTYDDSDGLGPEDYDHRVLVSYSYEGQVYADREYGNYSSSMKEGDTVILYVNPDDPAEFMSDPSGHIVFIIIGAALVLVGLGGIGYSIAKKKRSVA